MQVRILSIEPSEGFLQYSVNVAVGSTERAFEITVLPFYKSGDPYSDFVVQGNSELYHFVHGIREIDTEIIRVVGKFHQRQALTFPMEVGNIQINPY